MRMRCNLSKRYQKRLFQSKHEGVRYPCDKRDYAATWKGDLKKIFEKVSCLIDVYTFIKKLFFKLLSFFFS